MPAFHQGLAETSLIEGRTVTIEYRWAGGQYDQLPRLADLTRPEGNVTGGSFYTAPVVSKRLELARELVLREQTLDC
jgi:putative ABC transport system substrate-binding protein